MTNPGIPSSIVSILIMKLMKPRVNKRYQYSALKNKQLLGEIWYHYLKWNMIVKSGYRGLIIFDLQFRKGIKKYIFEKSAIKRAARNEQINRDYSFK